MENLSWLCRAKLSHEIFLLREINKGILRRPQLEHRSFTKKRRYVVVLQSTGTAMQWNESCSFKDPNQKSHLPFTVSLSQIWNGKVSEIFKKIQDKMLWSYLWICFNVAVDADEDVFLQLICFHLYIECLKLTLNITLNDLINQMQNHQSYSVTLC